MYIYIGFKKLPFYKNLTKPWTSEMTPVSTLPATMAVSKDDPTETKSPSVTSFFLQESANPNFAKGQVDGKSDLIPFLPRKLPLCIAFWLPVGCW